MTEISDFFKKVSFIKYVFSKKRYIIIVTQNLLNSQISCFYYIIKIRMWKFEEDWFRNVGDRFLMNCIIFTCLVSGN